MRRIVTTILLLAGFALPAAAATTITACSAISIGDLGALNGWVPSPNDAWHQDVSASPVDANSNKIMTTPGDLANRFLHPDFSNVVDGAYGIPYTIIDSTNVPFVTISPYDMEDSDNTLYPITATTPIEGSPGECWTDGNYDHHAIIIDRTTCAAYEIYQADLCAGQWTSYGNVIWDFSLPDGEKRPYGMSSVDAAGLSVFEGLIRYDEIVAGNINHAIRFTAVHTKQDRNNGYFTAPATHAAGNLWGTDDIMGMRIRLKSSFDASAFSQTNQVILNAMKKYGMILADNGGDMFFQGTPDPRWDDYDLNALKAIPSTAFEVVQMNPIYDSQNAPVGTPPTIFSFTASADNVAPGTPVTLTPFVGASSYEFVDAGGFTRGPITVMPNCTTTYTLYSRNEFDTSTASVTVNVLGGSPAGCTPTSPTTGTAPTIVFPTPGPQTYPAAPFAVAATSNSPAAITYVVLSGPATISGSVVTLTGTGIVSLEADQAANGTYTAGAMQMSFAVGSATLPTLQFSHIADQVLGVAPMVLSATSNSPGAITFSVLSGPATVAGNIVTLTGVGRVALLATQAASGSFNSTTASIAFNVIGGGALPGLAFNPIANQTYGVAPFAVSATSNSSAAITYSVASGPATMSGNIVTVTGVGAVTLQASQPQLGAYTASTVTTSFLVTGNIPTLTFAAVTSKAYGVAPFAVSATSNSTGAITYSVVSGPATLSGNIVTLTGAGTVTLQAAQAAAGIYTPATANTSFSVTGTMPTLAFTAVPDQTFGAAPFSVAATSNSTGAITYSVLSGSATVSGSTVTLIGAGTVTLQATQAAAAGYSSATASTSFLVTGATPNLSFTTIPNQTFGAAPFAVSAISNSTGAITLSVLSGPATISGSTVTLTGVGSVTLQASQAAAAGYTATTANTSFNVGASAPTLSFTAVANQTFGAAPFSVSATSNSTGAITYSVLSGPATISGSTVSLTGSGSVILQATQTAAGGFSAATASTSFNVGASAPTLSFTAVANQIFGAVPFSVSATSNSTGAITYSVLSGPATISGSTVSITGSGTVMLQAAQTAAGGFSAATASTSFNVTGITTALSFSPVANQTLGAAPFTVSASSNSSGAITYTVLNGPATTSGNVVTLTGVGTVTLQAFQAAITGYSAATASTSFVVTGAGPTLTFAQVPNKTFGAAPFTVSAASNSPAAITYAVLTGPATLAGNIVTLTGSGTVILQASQAASGSYLAASVTCSFSIGDASPTLTFNPIANRTFGAAPFTVSATSNSPGAIAYAVVSGPATVAGNTATLTGAGAVTLQASQAAAYGFTAAAINISFNVSSVTPTLTFQAIADRTFGTAPFAVSATSSSPGAIAYSVVSGPAIISGNLLTLSGAGTVVLQASQTGSSGYASSSANASFNVTAVSPTLSFTSIPNQSFSTAPFTVAATSNSPGAMIYSIVSGPATLAGNVVTLTGAGTVTVQASQSAAGGFSPATALASFNVSALAPSLNVNAVAAQTFGAAPFAIAATSNSPGTITYSILNGPAILAGNVLTLTGAGTVTVQASQSAAAGFMATTAVTSFNVTALAPSLTINTIAVQTFGASPFAVSANSNSTGIITYSILSGPAVLTGNTLALTGTGLVTLQASQAANGGYSAASAITSFTVNPAVPNLIIANVSAQMFGGSPIAIPATSNSPAPITWSVVSGPAVMVGSSVSFTAAGPVTLRVTQAPGGNFLGATATATFAVNPAVPTLTIGSIPTQTFGAGPLTVSATSNSATPITYSVLSGPATISGTTVTLVGAGGVTLQATQPASGNYLAGSATLAFTVAPSSVVLAGDFAMPNNITVTMNQGDSKSVTVPVSAINGFNGLVSFHCAVPAAMIFGVCNTTTAQLTSAVATSATVTVSTKGPLQTAAENRNSPLNPTTTGFVVLGCLLPCGLPFLRKRKINLRSVWLSLLLVLSMAAVSLTTTGCGAMILSPLTPAGTYVLNVNASSGSSAHAMTITVIVQQPKN